MPQIIKKRGYIGMSIVINRKMFGAKKLAKGGFVKRGKYLYWVNLWGFGIIITNTCKGLRYDMSLSQ